MFNFLKKLGSSSKDSTKDNGKSTPTKTSKTEKTAHHEKEKPVVQEKKGKQEVSDSTRVTKTLEVPRVQFGVIIGQGGSTIKQLRETTKAEITLPAESSTSETITIEGTKDAVEHCIKEIQKLLQQNTKEREKKHKALEEEHEKETKNTDKLYSKYQKEVDQLAERRSELFKQAEKEYAKGNKGKAHELREEAKEQTILLEKAQKKASRAIFDEKNAKYTDGMTVDLHGLHTECALELLAEHINSIKGKNKGKLTVIYGAGNHSEGNQSKVKPAVRKWLEENKYSFTEINNGSVSVTI